MVKLGSPFVKYDSTNNGTITSVKTCESTPTKAKSSFSFITSGNSIRDYVKRKIFKATKEEVSSLLKSTSNLNLAGVFSSKSSTQNGKLSKPKEYAKGKSSITIKDDSKEFEFNNQGKSNVGGYQQIGQDSIVQTEGTCISEGPVIINMESSTEIEEPVVKIKSTSCRKFSLVRLSKKKKKKTRFAEDLTQSLPAPSCSSPVQFPSPLGHKCQPKIIKWANKMRKCKANDSLGDKVPNGKSDDAKEEEAKVPVRWTKRVRKFAIRTCRYLGYGAQMVSPMTPYSDIPMPVTYDSIYNIYPPYYGSDRYYSYSSCGSVYGYKMSHYGLTY